MPATIEGYERKCEAEYQAGLDHAEMVEATYEEAQSELLSRFDAAIAGDGHYKIGADCEHIAHTVGVWLAERDDQMLDLLRGTLTVRSILESIAEEESDRLVEQWAEEADDREAA